MKVSELSGSQLDYWVARSNIAHWDQKTIEKLAENWICGYLSVHQPSSIWTHGGPIIEREGINLNQASDGWVASIRRKNGHGHHVGDADTPLEAAMRCYVASKFGEEVDDAKPA